MIPAIHPLTHEQTEEMVDMMLKLIMLRPDRFENEIVPNLTKTGQGVLQLAVDLGFIDFKKSVVH